jgi:Zn ribbon nucleic-acid-binding protein
MVKAYACDRCGYRPRTSDAQQIILNEGLDEYEIPIEHVRCYQCGLEWVE